MKKFVPYEKMSKKQKKKIDSLKRGSWYGVNPATRKSENPKAYKRKKTPKWIDDSFQGFYFLLYNAQISSPIQKSSSETAVILTFFISLKMLSSALTLTGV